MRPPSSTNRRQAPVDAATPLPHSANGRLLRISEFMERLSIGQSTAFEMLADGTIPYIRVRGDRRIAESDIEEYIARNRVAGGAK